MDIVSRLKRLFRTWRHGPALANDASGQALAKMLRQLGQTRDVEVTCDEVLDVLDQVAEAKLRGEDVGRLMPLVQHHLEMCRDCQEELEALLRILRASPAT
jgi:hypothetical protein